ASHRTRDPSTLAPVDGEGLDESPRGRLGAPLLILVLALTVSLAEIGYSRLTGTMLMLGPIRPFWITAPLAAFGLAFMIWRLIETSGETRPCTRASRPLRAWPRGSRAS